MTRGVLQEALFPHSVLRLLSVRRPQPVCVCVSLNSFSIVFL